MGPDAGIRSLRSNSFTWRTIIWGAQPASLQNQAVLLDILMTFVSDRHADPPDAALLSGEPLIGKAARRKAIHHPGHVQLSHAWMSFPFIVTHSSTS